MAVSPAMQVQLASLQQQLDAALAAREATRSRTGGEVLADTGLAALQGAVGLGQAAYGLGNLATAGVLDRAVGLSDNFQQTNQILNAARSAPLRRDLSAAQAKFDEGVLPGLGAYVSNPALLGDLAVQNIPSLIPAAAVSGRVAKVLGAAGAPTEAIASAATRAAIGTGAAQTGGAVNVDTINAIREAGGTETQQQLGGVGAGALAGLTTGAISKFTGAGELEAMVAARLAGVPAQRAAAASAAKAVAGGIVKEGGEETLQSGAEQLSQNLFTPGTDLGRGVAQQMALGGLMGGLLGGGLGALTLRQPSKQRADVSNALAEAASDVGVPQHGALTAGALSAGIGVEDIVPESIDIGATPLPELSPEEQLMAQLQAQAAQPTESLPTMGVEELPPGTPVSLPTMQVEEGLPVPDVQEIGLSQGRGTSAYNTRAGLDLLGDPRELGALGRVAPEAADPAAPAVSPNQLDFGFDPSPLQQSLNAQLGVDQRSGYQPIDWVEGQYLPRTDQMALPNPSPSGVQGALPAPPRAREGFVVDTAGNVVPVQDAANAGGIPYPAATAAGWKQQIVKDLGLTARQLQGKEWQRFAEAAVANGVRPGAPEAEPFLRAMAAELGADPANAGSLGAALGTKYGAVSPSPEPAAAQAPVEAPPATEVAGTTPEPAAPLTSAIQERAAELNEAGEPVGVYAGIQDVLADSHNLDDLDMSWQGVLASPEFKALSAAEQDTLAAYYSDLYDGIESNRFSRTGDKQPASGQAIELGTFREGVDAFNAKRPGKPPVIGHDSVADFKAATGSAAPADAAGVYMPDGSLHVIRENIADTKQLAFTLLHEQGHEGMRGLLGDRITAVTNRLRANPTIRKRMDARKDVTRAVAGEETLVDMLAAGEKLAPSLLGKIRAAVRQTAAKLFGLGDVYVSDTQVNQLLEATAKYLKTGNANFANVDLANDKNWARLDEYAARPELAENFPLFSLAAKGLNDAVRDAEGRNGSAESLSDPYKKAVDAAKTMFSKVTSRGSYNPVLDFVSLDRMVELNKHLFNIYVGGGKIMNSLVNLYKSKTAKDVRFHKLITQPQDIIYSGPPGADGNPTKEKFTISQMDLAKAWEKLISGKDRSKFDALNRMTQYSTYYKLFPDRADFAAQADVDYDTSGFTEAERREAHDNIRKLWNKLGADGQQVYKQAQAMYAHLWDARFKAIVREFERTAGPNSDATKQVRDTVAMALGKLKQGPYSPLNRFGNYFTTLRDEKGNVVHFAAHDSEQEAEAAKTDLWNGLTDEQRAPGGWTTQVSARQQFSQQVDGINHAQIAKLEDAVEKVVVPVAGTASEAEKDSAQSMFRNSLRDALVDAYLHSVPTHSLMNHANARRGVSGFNLDAYRAFGAYAMKAARNISSIEHDGQISRDLIGLNEMQKIARGNVNAVYVKDKDGNVVSTDVYRTPEEAATAVESKKLRLHEGQTVATATLDAAPQANTVKIDRVVNAVRAQHESAVKNEHSPLADTLGQASFAMFMTSPSQMFVNGMQPVMVALPRLSGRYGSGNAISQFGKSLKAYFSSGADMLGSNSTIDPETKRVLQEVFERGGLARSLAHDMNALADGDYTKMTQRRRAMMTAMSYFMHKSEVFNRQVTVHAAVELARKQKGYTGTLTPAQVAELADVAVRANDDTNLNYSGYNAPAVMQGPWRKVLLQFQKYRFGMLGMMAQDVRNLIHGDPNKPGADFKEARKEAFTTLSWLIGMQAAFAGAAGTVLSPIAFGIADLFRDDDELLDARTAFSRAVPKWMAHGIASDLIDTRRLGADSLLPIIGDMAYAPKNGTPAEQLQYHLLKNLGPSAGLATQVYSGAAALFDGDLQKAIKGMTPKPLADFSTAMYETQGAKDARGVTYYSPDIFDTVLGAAGLRSGDRVEANDIRGASYQAVKQANTTKQNLLGQLALGAAMQDQSLIRDADARIAAWNNKYPDLAIKGSDRKRAITNRVRAQAVADEYGIPAGKPPSVSVLRALNLAE